LKNFLPITEICGIRGSKIRKGVTLAGEFAPGKVEDHLGIFHPNFFGQFIDFPRQLH
jgi:hypothetical protein